MDEAGAVEEDVDGAHPRGKRLDRCRIARIERIGLGDTERRQIGDQLRLEVAGDHLGAFRREGDRGGAANAGSGCGEECPLALQPVHALRLHSLFA
jgi:hypothetical protein